jgi:hypothetical protein
MASVDTKLLVVVDELNKVKQNLTKVEEIASTVQQQVGPKGDKGDKGDPGPTGKDGADGRDGKDGVDGKDGLDGKDGVSVVDASVDFDNSLVLKLSDGNIIDAGNIIPKSVKQEFNSFMTRGEIIPTQSGNSGKYLTTDGNILSWDQINISTADITGTLPLANGGTGATTAPTARTNLGLGTIATQNANSVAVTGGSIDGTTIGGSTPAAGTFTTLTSNGQTSFTVPDSMSVTSQATSGNNYFNFVTSATSGRQAIAVQDGTRFAEFLLMKSTQAGYGNTNEVVIRASVNTAGLRLVSDSSATPTIFFSTGTTTSAVSEQFRITNTVSAVNYVQVTGAATTAFPVISVQGSDSNPSLGITSKGSGSLIFFTNNAAQRQFRVSHTASAVNYYDVTGSAAGQAPILSVVGTDTNIDLALTPKGTGLVRFGTHTATALTISGYVEIKDSGGTIRKLAVVT